MSYDLMVFEPLHAPRDKESLMKWYGEQIEWKEDHPYSDIQVGSNPLQRFYKELTLTFPSIDLKGGILEAIEEAGTENRITGYSIGKEVIYASFAWSVAEEAINVMRLLAKKHKVGFFDVSGSDGEVTWPGLNTPCG